ncbi:hypothetical protein JCM21531_2602 [Acetivibrio straminisolvens JCM 21531]|uniref:Uncharacterized protein n=1 Tax=Acetivibrio straminisolvens JCM 21531 TaxID=1294263 RepID=W4V8E6_9FIRM|nr:hypothetical protein JCM21531_2602 [Acetivibrio straminisolvens JCM 21531]
MNRTVDIKREELIFLLHSALIRKRGQRQGDIGEIYLPLLSNIGQSCRIGFFDLEKSVS